MALNSRSLTSCIQQTEIHDLRIFQTFWNTQRHTWVSLLNQGRDVGAPFVTTKMLEVHVKDVPWPCSLHLPCLCPQMSALQKTCQLSNVLIQEPGTCSMNQYGTKQQILCGFSQVFYTLVLSLLAVHDDLLTHGLHDSDLHTNKATALRLRVYNFRWQHTSWVSNLQKKKALHQSRRIVLTKVSLPPSKDSLIFLATASARKKDKFVKNYYDWCSTEQCMYVCMYVHEEDPSGYSCCKECRCMAL